MQFKLIYEQIQCLILVPNMPATYENNVLRWGVIMWRIEQLVNEFHFKINSCDNPELLRQLALHHYHLAWLESNFCYREPSEFNDPDSDSALLDDMIDYVEDMEQETRELLNMN